MDASEPESLFEEAKRFFEASKSCQVRVVTAESCTAGALATLLSDIPGAGDVLEGGFVSYSKSFKSSVLGVGAEFLREKSAVNRSVAEAMARGALMDRTHADFGNYTVESQVSRLTQLGSKEPQHVQQATSCRPAPPFANKRVRRE
jgi:hypothetical protein